MGDKKAAPQVAAKGKTETAEEKNLARLQQELHEQAQVKTINKQGYHEDDMKAEAKAEAE